MFSSGWCSTLRLGKKEELAPSFLSCGYTWVGKKSRSFSLCRHSDAEEGRRWRSTVLGRPTLLRVLGSRQPKTCLMLLSPAAGAGRTAAPGVPSSCLSPPAQGGWLGESRSGPIPCTTQEALCECRCRLPATLCPRVALASSPPKSGCKRSCLPLEVSSTAALLGVGLYLPRARPCFIELCHEVCPANALPWAVVTVLGDEQCWCLWEADEVGVLTDLCQVFLLLGFWGRC